MPSCRIAAVVFAIAFAPPCVGLAGTSESSNEPDKVVSMAFGWPFLDPAVMETRGGTTQGSKVTLAEAPSDAWTKLRQQGLSARERDRRALLGACTRIERLFKCCNFTRWTEIVPSEVVTWLAAEREAGRMGVRTSNYYLAAIKQFCKWLAGDGRVPRSRSLGHLSAINADADARWRRRAIAPDEFSRLIAAAQAGPMVQCMSGSDRAMLYILAAWTGYCREELASLTLKSLDLEGVPATVRVQAGYSKRRRDDVVPLHPSVVERLKAWI